MSAWRDHQQLDLGPVRQHAVLAVLALRPGSMVTTAELLDAAWGSDAPTSGDKIIPSYIYRLRRALHGGGDPRESVLVRERGGYLLQLPPSQIDLFCVEESISRSARAAASGDFARAAALALDAVQTWSGEPLAGLPGPHAQQQRARLSELRLGMMHQWIDAELKRGNEAGVIPALTELWLENPLRERFAGQLMQALTTAGRQAEALETYIRTRECLVEEIGIEPGAELVRMHEAVLRGVIDSPSSVRSGAGFSATGRPLESAQINGVAPQHEGDPCAPGGLPPLPATATGDSRLSATGTTGSTGLAPSASGATEHYGNPGRRCDLPGAVPRFTGREAELAQLVEAGVPDGPAPRIDVVGGMAGVGKTALALQAAHLLSAQYPEAQLFCDLRGFSPNRHPEHHGAALGWLLQALGIVDLPDHPGDRARLWRSTMAGRRAVIVLDNAADTAQVRPLLPGTPECRVIVTSRRRLIGLDATTAIALEVLPTDVGVLLLERIVGVERIQRHRHDAAKLVELCGGLPAAIRILAARLQHRPELVPGDLLPDSTRTNQGLLQLQAEDRAVGAAFAASYELMPPVEQQVFRLAADEPAQRIEPATLATRAGMPEAQVLAALDHLADANLVHPIGAGRYRLHRLMREFGVQLDRQQRTRLSGDHSATESPLRAGR